MTLWGEVWIEGWMSKLNRPIISYMKLNAKRFAQWLVGLLFILAGANHFISPKPYLSMMPAYLPWPDALVQISGVAEILGGLGVLFSVTRKWAALGLILLLVAVFPANLNVALNGWSGVNIAGWILWARLPFQLIFIWWVYRLYLAGSKQSVKTSGNESKR